MQQPLGAALIAALICPALSLVHSFGNTTRALLHENGSTIVNSTGASADALETIEVPNRWARDEIVLANLIGLRQNVDMNGWFQRLDANLRAHGLAVSQGHSNLPGKADQRRLYNTIAKKVPIRTVCETGFNAGHSALRFLAQSDAKFYAFDLGEHRYAHVSADFLKSTFPGRFHVSWGDSTKALPAFHAAYPGVKCDLVIVDGGHTYDVAHADLKSFASMAWADTRVVIDDTPCDFKWCKGPTQAWEKCQEMGCIAEQLKVHMDRGGFSVGMYSQCPAWYVTKQFKKSHDILFDSWSWSIARG